MRTAEKRPKWALRKLSVGLASVMVGATISVTALVQPAFAETAQTDSGVKSETVQVSDAQSDSANSASKTQSVSKATIGSAKSGKSVKSSEDAKVDTDAESGTSADAKSTKTDSQSSASSTSTAASKPSASTADVDSKSATSTATKSNFSADAKGASVADAKSVATADAPDSSDSLLADENATAAKNSTMATNGTGVADSTLATTSSTNEADPTSATSSQQSASATNTAPQTADASTSQASSTASTPRIAHAPQAANSINSPQTVTSSSLTLSQTTIGHDGKDSGITATVSVSGDSGDVYTITIPKSSTYRVQSIGVESLGGTVGNTTIEETADTYIITDTLTSDASFTQSISLDQVNNYLGQNSPMSDVGTKDLKITLSGDRDGASLGTTSQSYQAIVDPSMNPTLTRTAPSTESVPSVLTGSSYKYTYELDVNEPDGVSNDQYSTKTVNSAVNYGTTITIPVPSSFILDEDATVSANGFTDGTTITQAGKGADIVITVPKGAGSQSWQYKAGYKFVGYYDTDQPTKDTTISASGPGTVVQKIDANGTTLTEEVLTWSETLRGVESDTSYGQVGLSVGNAFASGELVKGGVAVGGQPYTVVNTFGISNGTIYNLNDAIITLTLADGLNVTGIKTPANNQVFAPGLTSYTYTLTYADGTQSSGTVEAGGIAKATGSSPIRKAEFVPNMLASGAQTAAAVPDQTEAGSLFYAIGQLADTYDNGSPVKRGDKLTSSISVGAPQFRKESSTGKITYETFSNKATQIVIGTDQLVTSEQPYCYQSDRTPGASDAGYVSVYKTANANTTDYMDEPTFYYVLPEDVTWNYETSEIQGSPDITTFWVGNQQVVKISYAGTGYKFPTTTGSINEIHLSNGNDADSGSYTVHYYVTTTTKLSQTKVSDETDFNHAFTEDNVNNTYDIGTTTWSIKQADALYMAPLLRAILILRL